VSCDIFFNLQRMAHQPSAHTFFLPNSPPFIHLLIYGSFPTERYSVYWKHLHFLLDILVRSVWLHRVAFYCYRQTDRQTWHLPAELALHFVVKNKCFSVLNMSEHGLVEAEHISFFSVYTIIPQYLFNNFNNFFIFTFHILY